jgi:carbon-monoxide dehydrogenase large subunit
VGLVSGTQSNGQGHETSFPQIAADLLGLPVDCFDLIQADTAAVPRGAGHGGARSLHMGGAALVLAIETSLARARTIAGRLLQCDPTLLEFAGGVFSLADGRAVDLLSLAREPEGIDCIVDTPLDLFTFPNGCHVAEVEVDPETGFVELVRYVAVDDYGRLINPMLTEGQVVGGLAQGIGQALYEHTAYDGGSGQFLAASFMDYQIPRAVDLPAFDIVLAGVPTAANPLGVKGAGQAGCIGAPQTVMNALANALGIEHLDMPATSERVWRALQV